MLAARNTSAAQAVPWYAVRCGSQASLSVGQVAGGAQSAVLLASSDECAGTLGTIPLSGGTLDAKAERGALVQSAYVDAWASEEISWARSDHPGFMYADEPGVKLRGPLARRAAAGSRLVFLAAERLGAGSVMAGWPVDTRVDGNRRSSAAAIAQLKIEVVEGAKLLPNWALLADAKPFVKAGLKGKALTRALYSRARRHRAEVPRALVFAGDNNRVQLSCTGGTQDVHYRLESAQLLPQGVRVALALPASSAEAASNTSSVVALSVAALDSDSLAGAVSNASILAVQEGDVTAVCHDAGELRGVWGRR